VSLVTGASPGSRPLTREVALPFVTSAGESVARLLVRASDAPLVELRRELDRWLLSTAVVAALLAGLLAAAAAAQLSGPLAALARRAGRIDLDRLDVSFPTQRLDEVGDLSRVLNRMTARLRASAARLRDAERRATTGDIARQVHHDVRNGLIPIRNVLSHLSQVAQESPGDLRDVFLQRQGTLESSVTYLQSLATNYARLSPSVERRPCDVNRIAAEVVADAPAADAGGGVRVESDLTPGLPPVLADSVALRRVLDNLVVNAVESLAERRQEGPGRVLVRTRLVPGPPGSPSLVELEVSDTGRGMSVDERARMFDDFYTTKARGTGLGLSIVRRLVNDMGGRTQVESEPEKGTRFTVELPAGAGAADPGPEDSVADEDAGPTARRTNQGFALHPEPRR
jgi:signal transduction histidine kinase